ncbi:MAG: ATP-binding protein [Phycisphaerales bacterium]|nr:ATP-binding protein [Phycisphaerales bacterium]
MTTAIQAEPGAAGGGGRKSVPGNAPPQAHAAAPQAAGSLAPADLAELLAAFNEVTAKLQSSHDRLRDEVARLNRELSEANGALERSRRLAALGEMAAGIAHEIRNPLGAIGLYARSLEEDLADRPEQRCVAGRISRAVRGLNAVVHDVLAFAGEVRPRFTDADATDLLARALEECIPHATGVSIRRDDLASAPPAVRCDPELMHRALVNVIRNACEAMADSAADPRVLALGVRPARLRPEGRADAVALVVRDTGPGVGPGVVERMFNPFFTTRPTGTGLGLAIVHRIIDAHGGRVSVRNNDPPPGATVELVVPGTACEGSANQANQEQRQ